MITPVPIRSSFAFVRFVLAVVALTVGVLALAQDAATAPAALADGSEVVVTDRHGEHLLGYGRIEQGVLRLSLASHDDDGLAVMLISPDGEVSTLVGRFAGDGIRVRSLGETSDVTLLSWMSDRGVTLTLERVARARSDERDDERDDGGDEDRADAPPGTPPSVPSDDDAGHGDDDTVDHDTVDDDTVDDDTVDDDASDGAEGAPDEADAPDGADDPDGADEPDAPDETDVSDAPDEADGVDD